MFNAAQLAQIAAIAKDGERSNYTYDGRKLKRATVSIKRNINAIYEELFHNNYFNGPRFIVGKPEINSALNGLKGRSIGPIKKSVFEVENAKLIGWRTVLTPKGELVNSGFLNRDISTAQAAEIINRNHDGFLCVADKNETISILYCDEDISLRLKGRYIFISALEPGNYGSFIFRILPKIIFLTHLYNKYAGIIVPERTPWLRQALDLFGFKGIPLFAARECTGAEIEALHIINDFDSEGFIDPYTYSYVQSIARKFASNDIARSKKIYVSRALVTSSRPSYRPLVNEVDISSYLGNIGFETIFAETCSFEQLIFLFSTSDFIIGPSGSGMLNNIFGRPRSRVIDIESHTPNVRQHAHIYDSTQKDYGFVFGTFASQEGDPTRRPWVAEIPLIEEAIRQFSV